MIKKVEDPIRWQKQVDRQVELWHQKEAKGSSTVDETEEAWKTSIITISREYGSRGFRIGELIAKKLNWQVYSRQLVEYIAETANLRQKVIADFDERKSQQSLTHALFDPSAYSSDKHYRHLVQVILSIAQHGSAVIIGRGANFIAESEKSLHVRVTASLDHRVQRYANKMKVSLKEARKIVESKDRERAEYIDHYFKADVDDPHHYHLVINVEHLTNEQVARMVIASLGIKMGSPIPDNTMSQFDGAA